jgi:hypothetical protein
MLFRRTSTQQVRQACSLPRLPPTATPSPNPNSNPNPDATLPPPALAVPSTGATVRNFDANMKNQKMAKMMQQMAKHVQPTKAVTVYLPLSSVYMVLQGIALILLVYVVITVPLCVAFSCSFGPAIGLGPVRRGARGVHCARRHLTAPLFTALSTLTPAPAPNPLPGHITAGPHAAGPHLHPAAGDGCDPWSSGYGRCGVRIRGAGGVRQLAPPGLSVRVAGARLAEALTGMTSVRCFYP